MTRVARGPKDHEQISKDNEEAEIQIYNPTLTSSGRNKRRRLSNQKSVTDRVSPRSQLNRSFPSIDDGAATTGEIESHKRRSDCSQRAPLVNGFVLSYYSPPAERIELRAAIDIKRETGDLCKTLLIRLFPKVETN